MAPISVEPVEAKADLRRFLYFPARLYQHDPLWVAPIVRDQLALLSPDNPFFAHAEVRLFLARRSREVVGRLAAIVDGRHLKRWEEQVGFFGFFESIHDEGVVGALLDEARTWLRSRGMTRLRGPIGLSTNYECGLLVEGYGHPPRVLTPYNPSYYASRLEGAGFTKVKDLLSYEWDLPQSFPEDLAGLARAAEAKGARVRSLNPTLLHKEAQVIRSLYNHAWQENWGFVPMDEAEAAFMADRLRPFLVPDLAVIAERADQPVGFALSLPDYNPALRLFRGRITPWGMLGFLWRKRSLKEMRVLAFGVLPAYRRRGIDALLIRATFDAARQRGYRRAELSWILEENTLMRRAVERLSAKIVKRYRLYEAPT